MVIPFLKGGDTLDPNCYRPISILPCLSKVVESQVNKQITAHVESPHTFSAMQSGFRAGHGCTSATLKVLNDVKTVIDKENTVQLYSSTWPRLSTLSITTFLSKPTALVSQMTASSGSSTTSQTEFSLSNRRACCPDLSMGVPQGSILGPTLFSVYVNDVALAAGDSLNHFYADDTILYTSGPCLDTVLTNLQTSFNAIQLSFCGLQLFLTVCL